MRGRLLRAILGATSHAGAKLALACTNMSEVAPLLINCAIHGHNRVSAVVCGHMVESAVPVGFVENNDDPDNLQAWCEKCEAFFVCEGDKTKAFLSFNRMALVCVSCYQALKSRHTLPPDGRLPSTRGAG